MGISGGHLKRGAAERSRSPETGAPETWPESTSEKLREADSGERFGGKNLLRDVGRYFLDPLDARPPAEIPKYGLPGRRILLARGRDRLDNRAP